jgi:hypothetical protein
LTPLPLLQSIQPEEKPSSVQFGYAPDLSYYGQGTADRPAQPMKRKCGTDTISDCTPSDELFAKLSSGSVGTTLAGPKEIQFRNFLYYTELSTGDAVPVGLTRPIQYLILNPTYTIVEGLVVDPVNGGIGFRNHTIPNGKDSIKMRMETPSHTNAL